MKQSFIGKKGGSSNSTPVSSVRTPDNLRSKDTVEVILGLCEGPIYGLADGNKSFFVGDTRLQNDNGEDNFKFFQLDIYPGDEDAEYVYPVLGGFASNKAVNVPLASLIPVTRQTQSGALDYIDFRLAVTGLYLQTDEGTFTADLVFRIEYKPVSEVTWTKVYGQDIKLTGKTTSTYVKEIRVKVDQIDEPYDLRVTQITPESDVNYTVEVSWESFQEVTSAAIKHNNTALAHLVAESSDQFSSIPQWSGEYKGLLCRVPVNYDPITRVYSGIWDGTWQIAWTDNPVWCLYDFVVNDRYGMKAYYPELILDKYDCYEAAQWCDEAVPNGQGGTQPRYTFNAYITEARSGKELARYIAGVFNGTLFDDLNASVFLKVDKDDAPVAIFMKENIYEEFEYSYTDITTRYNDITVTHTNPNLNWEEDRRRVFDQTLINKNGRIPLDFIAVGCLDTHEAVRRAQYKLITANTENCIIKFSTNRLAQAINPYDVILICDPDQGTGMSGRIKSLNIAQDKIYLRDPIYLEAGIEYAIQVSLKDGTFHDTVLLAVSVGYNTELNVETAIPENVNLQATFTISSPDSLGLPRPFRVVKCEEQDGNPDMFTIEGININRNKWYDSDNVTNSGVIDYQVLPDPLDPPGPINVGFSERYIKKLKQFQIIVSPQFNRGLYKYYKNDFSFEVWSRPTGTTDTFIKRDIYYSDTLINHPPGNYDFKILGVSFLGMTTPLEKAPTYTFNVTNPSDPPSDVDWILINNKEVYWGYRIPPEDFAGFELRYHNQEDRFTWDDAQKVTEGIITSSSLYTNLIPNTARVIMIKAVDDFGNYSVNSTNIIRVAQDAALQNVVETIEFHPTFAGTKVECSVSSGELRATDTGTLLYSGVPSAFMYDGGLFYTAVYNTMEYYPTFTLPVAGTFSLIIDCDNGGFEMNIRKAGEVSWQPIPVQLYLEAGDYELQIIIYGGPTRGIIRELTAIIDVPDIEEIREDVTIPAMPTRIVPLKSYIKIKKVDVTIQGSVSSDAVTYRVNDKNTVLGPQIVLLDILGNVVSGKVDVTIKGY